MKTFSLFSWIPLAFWVAVNVDISRAEGWGAWAAAGALVYPLFTSLIFGLIGGVLFWRLPAASRRSLRSLAALILPWIPFVLLFLSRR